MSLSPFVEVCESEFIETDYDNKMIYWLKIDLHIQMYTFYLKILYGGKLCQLCILGKISHENKL